MSLLNNLLNADPNHSKPAMSRTDFLQTMATGVVSSVVVSCQNTQTALAQYPVKTTKHLLTPIICPT